MVALKGEYFTQYRGSISTTDPKGLIVTQPIDMVQPLKPWPEPQANGKKIGVDYDHDFSTQCPPFGNGVWGRIRRIIWHWRHPLDHAALNEELDRQIARAEQEIRSMDTKHEVDMEEEFGCAWDEADQALAQAEERERQRMEAEAIRLAEEREIQQYRLEHGVDSDILTVKEIREADEVERIAEEELDQLEKIWNGEVSLRV